MDDNINCAKCSKTVCDTEQSMKGPDNCPTRIKADVIEQSVKEYDRPEIREFARQASIQEFENYMNMPEGLMSRNCRMEEVVQFAKKMGYKKLGIAFCIGLRHEAEIVTQILENRGFEVVSVCCKTGGIPKERIGIKEDQKISTTFRGPGHWETMCSPITQAAILNDAEVDFNVLVGLCVGHDSLFFKYAEAPVTILIVKDRVFGHNPAAALYLSTSPYYRRMVRKEPLEKRIPPPSD
ncbi:DUF1847 domain-containing protein [Chloroflexota bacterium]